MTDWHGRTRYLEQANAHYEKALDVTLRKLRHDTDYQDIESWLEVIALAQLADLSLRIAEGLPRDDEPKP